MEQDSYQTFYVEQGVLGKVNVHIVLGDVPVHTTLPEQAFGSYKKPERYLEELLAAKEEAFAPFIEPTELASPKETLESVERALSCYLQDPSAQKDFPSTFVSVPSANSVISAEDTARAVLWGIENYIPAPNGKNPTVVVLVSGDPDYAKKNQTLCDVRTVLEEKGFMQTPLLPLTAAQNTTGIPFNLG